MKIEKSIKNIMKFPKCRIFQSGKWITRNFMDNLVWRCLMHGDKPMINHQRKPYNVNCSKQFECSSPSGFLTNKYIHWKKLLKKKNNFVTEKAHALLQTETLNSVHLFNMLTEQIWGILTEWEILQILYTGGRTVQSLSIERALDITITKQIITKTRH